MVQLNQGNPQYICHVRTTLKETSIQYYITEIKFWSKQSISSWVFSPKMPRTILSAGEVMVIGLWDCQGIIFGDDLRNRQNYFWSIWCIVMWQIKKRMVTITFTNVHQNFRCHKLNILTHSSRDEVGKLSTENCIKNAPEVNMLKNKDESSLKIINFSVFRTLFRPLSYFIKEVTSPLQIQD